MKDIFLAVIKQTLLFLLLFATTGFSVDEKETLKKISFADYLAGLQEDEPHSREYTFNTDLKVIEGSYQNYSVQNIIVAFDMSGSTKFFSSDCDRSGKKIKNVLQSNNATKHIALAQAEALSLVLKYLAKTNSNGAKLYLVGFSTDAQRPINMDFPYTAELAHDLEEIANNVAKKLPYPNFGGTNLNVALLEVLNASTPIKKGNTLFVILTDGQTNDASKTSEVLKNVMQQFTDSQNHNCRFDVLAIGAGSIVDRETRTVGRDALRASTITERYSKFSHELGHNPHFSGAQCNMGYLQFLTSLTSPLGKGKYGGAYKDYEDLQNIMSAFFSDLDDGSYKLFVETGNGGFWHAKAWQSSLVSKFLLNGEPGLYHEGTYTAHIAINPETDLLEITDVNINPVKRRCLWLLASHINAVQRADSYVFDVSSPHQVIEDMINRHFGKNN